MPLRREDGHIPQGPNRNTDRFLFHLPRGDRNGQTIKVGIDLSSKKLECRLKEFNDAHRGTRLLVLNRTSGSQRECFFNWRLIPGTD